MSIRAWWVGILGGAVAWALICAGLYAAWRWGQ